MSRSLLTSSPSTSFLSPTPLKLSPSFLTLPKRHRFRVSFPRSSAAESPSAINLESKPHDVFGGKRELSGVQSIVNNLSPPLRLVSSAVILAGALAAGYGLGTNFGGGSRNLVLGGAAVTGAAGGAVVYALNSAVPEVAAINLHNYVSGFDDPTEVSKEEIEGIAKKYGVSKQDEAFNAELCDLYCQFVSSVLPPGGEELRGNEVETIINFKNALGTQMQLACMWSMGGGFSGKGSKLEILMVMWSSVGAGISEIDLCFNSCFWRSVIISFTLEACFQGY